ncbi:hypothetical protein BH10ACT1_BH10ACT1_18060 [soil metagenome]
MRAGNTRFTAALATAAMAAAGLSGCLVTTVAPPDGAGALRYRDAVFADVSITSNLAYGSAPDNEGKPVTLRLDLFQPTGDTVSARPAVVYAHSGGFGGGDKGEGAPLMEALVRRGFVAVSINYRLLATSSCDGGGLTTGCINAATGAIDDTQAAVRWLRANASRYRIDPNRIAVEGFSAGGVIATGIGARPASAGNSGNPGHSSAVQAWVSIAGGLPGGQGIGAGDPPGYLFSGTADTTVPHQWSVDTARALSDAGGYAALRIEPGGGHDIPDQTMLAQQTANFYYGTLKLKTAAR